MYAISIRQPWAWTIVGGYKDVENRSWPVPSRFVGQRIAIHAGKQLDKSGIAQLDFGAIIGSVEIVDCVFNHCSPWAMPQHYHWVLANPTKFDKPIPYKGQLGFFEVSLAVLED